MYLYHFNSYIGTDRVSFTEQDLGKPGDLFFYKTEYVLILGSDVAWKEQIKSEWKFDVGHIHERYGGVIDGITLLMIHWFANERYTTYKNTLPLWIHDVEDIVKRSQTTDYRLQKKKKKIHTKKIIIEGGRLVQSDEEID